MLKIKLATKKEIPVILDLWKEFNNEHEDIILPNNKTIKSFFEKNTNAKKEYKKFTKKNIKSKKSLLLIAYVNDKPSGYALHIIKPISPIYSNKETGYISDLYVKKEFQGKGISSKLKDLGLQWFKKNNIEYVTLQVFSNNNLAEKIYDKWGFKKLKTELIKKI
jgi:ribosomal protein S18 acetylase RimI-like enzyme